MSQITNPQKVFLSSIASKIDYCLLQTDAKCLIGGAMKIYCSSNHIVAIGRQSPSNDVCYVFDKQNGFFIRQISSLGNGPNEYQYTNALFWDGVHEQVSVNHNSKHAFYNLDGSLSHLTNYFRPSGNPVVAFDEYYVKYVPNHNGEQTIRIAFYNKAGVLIDSILEYRSWKRQNYNSFNPIPLEHSVYIFHNSLYYKDLACDTLYHIVDFHLQPRFIFQTGDRSFPYEMQEGGRYETIGTKREDLDRYERYVVIDNILENGKQLFFTIDLKLRRYLATYNKSDDKLQVMPPVYNPPTGRGRNLPIRGFENDLDGGLPFWPQQIISDKEMMCVYTAEELLALDRTKITNSKLTKVLNQLQEDSNPVVAIVTTRD